MDPLREVRNRLLNGWQLSKLYTFEWRPGISRLRWQQTSCH